MSTTSPKPFIFVLMPFNEKFTDIYELGIKAASIETGAYCERVDEQIFEERILDRIYNQIAKADIIISDMTDRNPNVFYEAGYAHALGKRVILITQKSDDIPFDLKHFPHIIYGGVITELKEELQRRIAWAIEHPKEKNDIIYTSTEYLIQGVKLEEGAQSYVIEHVDSERKDLVRECQIDMFNMSDSTIIKDQVQLSLITEHYTSDEASLLRDGRYIHPIPIKYDIYPGSHISYKLRFHIPYGIDHPCLSTIGSSAWLQETSRFGKFIRNFNLKLIAKEKLEQMVHSNIFEE
ncbi:MAG: hypothetical protein JAZ12_02135 [Candidatus Thiodiazotropha taylori]|nr:hypothetical protein [Candidatus Thiodiazotropha taylori]